MAASSDRRGAVRLSRVLIVAAGLLSGCTMCPDPYDYSGPVPNGSAPQNDFRARSRGIIPIGSVSRPWPPLVQNEPAGESDSDTVLVTAEEPEADARPQLR